MQNVINKFLKRTEDESTSEIIEIRSMMSIMLTIGDVIVIDGQEFKIDAAETYKDEKITRNTYYLKGVKK